MILNYKDFNENVEFKNKTWIDINLTELDDIIGSYIWDMYKNTYLNQKLDLSAKNWTEMKRKYKATFLIDIDNDQIPDAFIIYKTTKFGNKLALMATNGKKGAKRKVLNKIFDLLNTRGWYLEASKRMEEILSKSDINIVKNEKDIKKLITNATIIGDGYYNRVLSKVDKIIIKRIYGNPLL